MAGLRKQKTSIRIDEVPLDIRTEYLVNARLVLYGYTNLLGVNNHVLIPCCML
jgi:hypothetical protein